MTTEENKPHKHNDDSYEDSAKFWHAEVVRLRAELAAMQRSYSVTHDAYLDRLEERNALRKERDIARHERDLAQACECVFGFEALFSRIIDADLKHFRDLPDGRKSAPLAREKLDDARDDLARLLSWVRVLECEVAEVVYALAAESPARLADELLDVATVSLRWRRAILERGTE